MDTLDGRNEGRSTKARDVNNALQAVHEFGDELHRDQSMQRFLQQYKFMGVRLCRLALRVEILGGLFGDTALFRHNIGTIDTQGRYPKLLIP